MGPGAGAGAIGKAIDIMKVLIVYYSTYGNVFKMTQLVAEGVRAVEGAEPVVRTVPELIPQSIIDSRPDMKAGRDMQKDVPLVTLEDFRQAGALAFGTPTRFGNVSSQLKNQIDQLTGLWLKGELEGKPAGVFVSAGSLHGWAGNDALDPDGAAPSSGDGPCGRAVLGARAVYDARRRLAVWTGARGRARQQTRNRSARSGHLPGPRTATGTDRITAQERLIARAQDNHRPREKHA
jgi:multimeric flavodoxin WrbA